MLRMMGRHLLVVAGAGVVGLLTSCGDGGAFLFPQGASYETIWEEGSEGTAGLPMDELPAVDVRDVRGNPRPGLRVEFRVVEGGGSVSPGRAVTDRKGRARPDSWILGPEAGPNVLIAELGSLGEVRFRAEGVPGAPAQLEQIEGEAREAPVASTLPGRPAVRVVDAFGNPVFGVSVSFRPEEGTGPVEGDPATSGEDGVARAASWTLGTRAGTQRVKARAATDPEGTVPALPLEIRVLPGPVAGMEPAAPEHQEGEAGTAVFLPPAVLCRDEFGNPVPGVEVRFSVTEGGGRVEGSPAASGEDGIARAERWLLGPDPGPNRVAAVSDAVGELTFTAEGGPLTTTLTIRGTQLNQGNQSPEGTIGGVAERAGLLRVVAQANQPNARTPDLLVRLFADGALVREELLPAPGDSVPVTPDLHRADHTWNLLLSAPEIAAGLEVEAILDPDSVVPVAGREGHRYPRERGHRSLDVRLLPPFEVVFVPVHWADRGLRGTIRYGNVESFLENVPRWIPSGEVIRSVRPAFVTDLDLATYRGWSDLIGDLQAMRIADGAEAEYYHGIVPDFPGIPLTGLAYQPDSPASPYRTAISYDRLPEAAETVAHELGHNLGRRHAPCGAPPVTVDPAFPYSGGGIGQPGFDVRAGALLHPDGYYDFMGYCRPRATSDYTWEGILEWRRSDPWAEDGYGEGRPALHHHPRGEVPGILVWGWVGAEKAVLNPAFTLTARPALPTQDGAHRLRAVGRDGREIFRLSFRGTKLGHGPLAGKRHFAYFVPLERAELEALDRIELAGSLDGGRTASVRQASARGEEAEGTEARAPEVRVHRDGGRGLRVEWDRDPYPAALLRERSTGRVLGILRSGAASLDPVRIPPEDLEVLISDGIRNRAVRPLPR